MLSRRGFLHATATSAVTVTAISGRALKDQVACRTNIEHHKAVSKKRSKPPQAAPPAATGNAGPQFEGKVGAFYLLSLLSSSEPRGLPGATIHTVEFQQRGSGRPLDDVIVQATNADGSSAILEIQAKRTLTFTASDKEFTDVVVQMWEAAQEARVRIEPATNWPLRSHGRRRGWSTHVRRSCIGRGSSRRRDIRGAY